MTVYQQIYGNEQVYTGLSTDTKPSAGSNQLVGANPGDQFFELDTGFTYVFDGSSWNVFGTNTDQKLLTLTGAGSGTSNTGDLRNTNGSALNLGINITSITGTSPTLTVTIQGRDFASGTYYTILSSAALTAAGFTLLQVGPGLTASANSVANSNLPRTWRVSYTIGGTTPSVTATVGASIVV